MCANYKPVGGVESAVLYPADAVVTALFSNEGCEVSFTGTPLEVALIEDKSLYEECAEYEYGVAKISHQLHLVADREDAKSWLEADFLEQASIDGVVALLSLCDGRKLLVGYSAQFGNEQPLRLKTVTTSSGTMLRERPTVALQLTSFDTTFSQSIL